VDVDPTDSSLIQIIARYYSPFALPRQVPGRHASRGERARVRRINLLQIRPFMRRYIFRSGQLVMGCFVASLLFASLLPFPLLAIAASIGVILAVLHTVLLIFLQQWANDIAAREARETDKTEH
jgi:uncharacterized protein YhhL (DUF1145 family)